MIRCFAPQVFSGQAGLLGGQNAVTEADNENVKKAKEMVIKDVKQNHKDEHGYKTTSFDFTDWDITKQVYFIWHTNLC